MDPVTNVEEMNVENAEPVISETIEEQAPVIPIIPNGMPIIVGYFEIPDELAKELSELLIKQSIRQRVLTEVVGNAEKYEAAEDNLIPVVRRVEAIKIQITKHYVPKQYDSIDYVWNYNGYEISGNKVELIKVN